MLSHLNAYIADLLNAKHEQYNQLGFIDNDPVSIPHRYTRRQDIEITGFIAATLAWGQRRTIISKCQELFALMDNAPHDFIRNHQDTDLKPLLGFKHRTFNSTDLLYFVAFFKWYYARYDSLEWAFANHLNTTHAHTENALRAFHDLFCSLDCFPARTRKHIATPARKSSCKRLNMFLRWMVRHDDRGVDFGLWRQISPSQLVCPCDVHVERVARKLGLIQRPNTDWQTALELTQNLRLLDPTDPVKYDFALFGLGIEGQM